MTVQISSSVKCPDDTVCDLFFFLSKVFLLPFFFFTRHLFCLEISSSNEQLNSNKFREKADGAAEVSKTQVIKKKEKKRGCGLYLPDRSMRFEAAAYNFTTEYLRCRNSTHFSPPWLVSKMFISLPFYSLFIHFKSAHLVLSLRCTCFELQPLCST